MGTAIYHQGAIRFEDGVIRMHATGWVGDVHWTGGHEVSPEDRDYDFWTWMIARSYPREKVVSEDSDLLQAYRTKYELEKVPPVDRTYSCNYCGTKLTPKNLIQAEGYMEGFLVYSCPQCQNDAKINLQKVPMWPQQSPAEDPLRGSSEA
jgi:hypothetical protein